MTQVDLVDVVSPVDQESAPDHDSQDREIDPVHPADSQRMFGDYFLHINPIRAKIVNSGGVQSLQISRFYHKYGRGGRAIYSSSLMHNAQQGLEAVGRRVG